MTTDELVNVLVPKQFLSRVYGLIAELEESGGLPAPRLNRAGQAQRESTDPIESVDEWTPSRLRTMVEQSPPAMRDILETLAERTGEWLSTDDLAAAIRSKPNANSKTVAGTLGAFGRRLTSRYGLESWPFEWRRDFEIRGMVYRMSEDFSRQILQFLHEGD